MKSPLLALDDALAQLLASVTPLQRTELVSTFEADGRVLAQAVTSPLNVPGFDNSQMDGYAVRVAQVQDDPVRTCTLRVPAGHAPCALPPGEVARVFTGAPIPWGADAVVMQEDVQVLDQCQVRIKTLPVPGQWIRRLGEDVQQGASVLAQGTRLNPAALGLAASVGMAQLCVRARPRVALFSTGDELVMPGQIAPADLPAGAVYNSNRFFLRALLERMGCQVTDLGIVPDQRGATVQALAQAAATHDLIVTSGGVSVGEEDHVKPAVAQLGRLNLWQVAMKPGKPFALGELDAHAVAKVASDAALNLAAQGRADANAALCRFVGLPGNPVSSWVTFLLLVRPLLLRLQGVPPTACALPVAQWMRADFEVTQADKRREFLRVRRNHQGGLDLFPNQSSGVLTSAVWGDGLVDKPAGQTIGRGDQVLYRSFSEFLA